MTCPNVDILTRFADATLPNHEAEDVVAHLAVCEACSGKVDELEHFPIQPVLAELRSLQSVPTETDDPSLPKKIAQYEILEKIGHGGMGVVYRAVHPHLKREVALKVIRDSRLDDPSARERFVQEMQSLGKLTHPNIVHATDAGSEPDGQTEFPLVDKTREVGAALPTSLDLENSSQRPRTILFIVTELLDGQDLGSYIEQHGKMPVKLAVDVIRQAATGLAYAHKAGYVHRDVKPSNLFLCYNTSDHRERVNTTSGSSNRPSGFGLKILDLGIARPLADSAGKGQTQSGHVVGSPMFMAPELLRGGTADARSDIYSLGQTFVCLLAGQTQIPSKLKPILARMTAGLPDQRYQTADELIQALDSVTKNSRIKYWMAATLIMVSAVVGFMMIPSTKAPVVEPLPTPAPTVIETKTEEERQPENAKTPENDEKLRRMSENKKNSERFKRELSEYKEAMAEWRKTREGDPPVMPEMPDILPPVD